AAPGAAAVSESNRAGLRRDINRRRSGGQAAHRGRIPQRRAYRRRNQGLDGQRLPHGEHAVTPSQKMNMNRFLAVVAAALLPICASAAPTKAEALKAYAARALAKCPDGKIALEPIDRPGPIGFVPYTLKLTSSDTT